MEVTIDRNKASSANHGPANTPHTARQRFNLTSIPGNEDMGHDLLEELLNQTWTLCAVSVLFNFQHRDEVHLKLYAKRLKEEIANSLPYENVMYDTTFTIMNDIVDLPSSMDPFPLKIEIFSRSSDMEESTQRCIYKGIFISWGTKQKSFSDNESSLILPFVLCRGTRSCMQAVHSIMSRMFDCTIINLPINEEDLMWLIPIVIMSNHKEENKFQKGELQMEYTIPELQLTDTIILKYPLSGLSNMLTVICGGNNNETGIDGSLTVEQVEKFHQVLKTQMLEVAHIQLGLCRLHKIHLPVLTVAENKMKATDPDVIHRVLLYINEKALDALHRIYFDTQNN